MKIKCTRFLIESLVSASLTSVRLSGERQLHLWSSGQRRITALMKSKRSIFLHLQNKKDTSISYHVYLKCNN